MLELEKFWNLNDVDDTVARSGLRRTVTQRTSDKFILDFVDFVKLLVIFG